MKLVISLLLSFSALTCELNRKFNYISLSGPATMTLKELGIINQASYISSFHPFKEKVPRIIGGVFLKPSLLRMKKNTVLFYDKSKDFSRSLKKEKGIKVEFATDKISAVEASYKALALIQPYLNSCKLEVSKLKSNIFRIQEKLKKMDINKTVFFYLGPFNNKKNNSLIIANDGFVLDLKNKAGFHSYPSNLSYVNWSQKVVSRFKDALKFGLSSDTSKTKIVKVAKNTYNIKFPGSTIPGISQVKFLDFLLLNVFDIDK